MADTVNFNLRFVPAKTAKRIMALADKAGTSRENYIRKLLDLHVELAERLAQTPGRHVIEAQTPEQVSAAIAAERA